MTQVREIQKHIAPSISVSDQQKIPRIIHQTFETNIVPLRMYQAAMSWTDCNNDYEYRFFDAENRISLISENFSDEVMQAYNLLENGAFKADLWRYCALYIYGGVYSDIDTVCQRPLSKLIKSNDEFIVPNAVASSYSVFNAFICSTPKHPFLRRAIDNAVETILTNKSANMFDVTGPTGLGKSINLELGRNEKHAFEIGEHCLDDLCYRILEKIHTSDIKNRRVMDGDELVFLAKYEGYHEDLESISIEHWTNKTTMPTEHRTKKTKRIKTFLRALKKLVKNPTSSIRALFR